MAFAADITGTLAGLIPAQQALVSGLAAVPTRPLRKVEKRSDSTSATMVQAGELLPIGLIREAVQECLQDAILDTSGALSALMADNEIVLLLHQLMGRPGQRDGVGRSLQEVVDAFSALAAKDGQPADVVQAIDRFTDKLRSTTQQLNQLRLQAAEQLQHGLGKVNELLARIAETNRRITLSAATGTVPPLAGEQQRVHLQELAKSLDFASFRREDGSVAVFTKKGITLAKDEAVRLETSESGIRADGIDIADQLSAGAVHAYLHNRDVTLPNVQSQLDTLAQTLQSRINLLSNRAAASADARSVYKASRAFTDPALLRLSLTGGDSELLLLREDGIAQARVTLSLAVKHYRRSFGLPAAGPWPVGQVVAAIDYWLGLQSGNQKPASGSFARLSDHGRLQIDLPAASQLRLAIRDSRSLTLTSQVFPSSDRPLGLIGQLTLTDGVGNEYSSAALRGGVAISPQDSLQQLVGKIARLEGLNARLVSQHAGSALQVSAHSDLYLEPDPATENLSQVLNLVPAEDQPREDVAVNGFSIGRYGQALSRGFASPSHALGLQGSLILRDLDGAMLAFQSPQPDWGLEKLVERLQSVSDPRISASLLSSGNQFLLRIAMLAPDDRFVIEGWPEGWQTGPRFGFSAMGGDLLVRIGGKGLPALPIAAGAGLADIAAQIDQDDSSWARAGLRAQTLRAGNAEILDIGHRGGLPLSFSGASFGTGAGQLDLRYNLRDQLGLNANADQVVPGLANFFGLNDLLVVEPAGAFDSKAAIGVFATTATPGTAAALSLNSAIQRSPELIGATNTIRQISDLLCNAINIAGAGDLPRGSYRLADYAEAIIRQVDSAARNNKVQLSYHRALLDRLSAEKGAEIDVNQRLQTLMTLQQTYNDATQIVAGLARLNDQLRLPVH